MKRGVTLILILVLLSGCTNADSALARAMYLRDNMLKSNGCTFCASVTADYGDRLYTFSLACKLDSNNVFTFKVIEPETIAGITGVVSEEKGKLVFDEQALLFDTIAQGEITPVSAPWAFIEALRGGYISGCGNYDNGLYIQIDDSYAEDALHMDVWTNEHDIPIRAEILWQGRRVLSMDVENFVFL